MLGYRSRCATGYGLSRRRTAVSDAGSHQVIAAFLQRKAEDILKGLRSISMDKYVIRYLFGQVGYAVLVAVGIAVAVWLVVHGINWLYTTTRLIGAT